MNNDARAPYLRLLDEAIQAGKHWDAVELGEEEE